MKKISTMFILILLMGSLFSQGVSVDEANKVLNDRGEVYFAFSVSDSEIDRDNLLILSRLISIDRVDGNKVIAYANKKGFDSFVNYNYEFDVLTPPSMMDRSILENTSHQRNTDSWDYYPNWNEYLDIMNQFVSDYPELCELVSLGTSNEGRGIYCIHINNNLGVEQNEPEFLYTSSIHGDELAGYILTLRYIDYLLTNYNTDPEIKNLVDNIDIWINPLANPDGTFAGGNSSVWGATRFNSQYVDLNRNYEDPQDGPHPDGNPWQTETLLFMDFAEQHDFVMSANMHGGAEVINYPWDTWWKLHADTDWWEYVSREYADLAHENGWPGYLTDLDNGVTNGAAWYSISGGRQDYMNYFHHTREVTMELSSNKMPSESQLNNFWDANYKSLLAYMKQVQYGFSGVITNSVNNNPIEAKVEIVNHDEDNSWVFSNLPLGNYNRLIKAGSYDVTFSADGYYDQIIDVNVVDDENLELDVQLVPIDAFESEYTSASIISIYPNPTNSELFLELEKEVVDLELTDISGRLLYSSDKANVITKINVDSYNQGVYLLSFSFKGHRFTEKIFINR